MWSALGLSFALVGRCNLSGPQAKCFAPTHFNGTFFSHALDRRNRENVEQASMKIGQVWKPDLRLKHSVGRVSIPGRRHEYHRSALETCPTVN